MPSSKLRIEENAYGLEMHVRATPAARRNAILGLHDGALRLAVTAAPERGKANKAIIEFLAKSLGVPKSAVEVVAGETSREKRVRVVTQEVEAVRRVLEEIIAQLQA